MAISTGSQAIFHSRAIPPLRCSGISASLPHSPSPALPPARARGPRAAPQARSGWCHCHLLTAPTTTTIANRTSSRALKTAATPAVSVAASPGQRHRTIITTTTTTTSTSIATRQSRRTGAAAAGGAAAAAAASAAAAEPIAPSLVKEVEVVQAATAAELRAAAFLRAISFYTYPPGRSEYAARSHRHMKANAEWDSVTAKVEGRDAAYRDLSVTCFIATLEDVDGPAGTSSTTTTTTTTTSNTTSSSTSQIGIASGAAASTAGSGPSNGTNTAADRGQLLAALRADLDASAQLPAEPGAGPGPGLGGDPRVGEAAAAAPSRRPRRLVVGSLDLNVGHTLPSEELSGRYPQAEPRRRRAYLSNVCVAPAARRLGVARALLRHAEEVARRAGVEWLYVHVVVDNAPAVALYCGALGFQVEQSESEGYARSLQRPRRLLLAKCLLEPPPPPP